MIFDLFLLLDGFFHLLVCDLCPRYASRSSVVCHDSLVFVAHFMFRYDSSFMMIGLF